MSSIKRQTCRLAIFCVVFSCIWPMLRIPQLVGVPVEVQAQPVGYQEYYVLGYEEHVRRAFLEIYGYAGPSSPPQALSDGYICSTISLVATADFQIVYYDHWEDGYESDLLNPMQSTTSVFGDGNPDNGGSGNDIMRAGDALNLTSTQGVGGFNALTASVPVAPYRDPNYLRYDGGDRMMTSGGPVNLAHAMWVLNNSWIGGAWEVPSRQTYEGTYVYRLPIGQDLYDAGGGTDGTFGDFRNVYLQLLAFEDNTTVSIDNGSAAVNLTLDRGQTYSSIGYVDSTSMPAITIEAGTVIRSNKPTQVGLITGADEIFQSRFMIVFPDKLLGADYVVPVPSGSPGHEAEMYLFNPNHYPITVQAYDRFSQTSFTIGTAAGALISSTVGSTVAYSTVRGGSVPADTAVRFTSADGVFGVLVCADSSNPDYDWGFTGIPAQYLTQDYYIAWAPGSANVPPTENGSPVWVTPLADDTTFYVDFSPLDGLVDQIFVLDTLEQRRLFDPDNDNTGMHVWATGPFAAAWGQDSRTASELNPYLDLGLTSLPLRQRWHDPILTISNSADPTVLPPEGGVVTFTLVVQAYEATVADIGITDTLPVSWTYVPASAQVIYPAGGGSLDLAPTTNGRHLFWDTSSDLAPRQSLTLTFQAAIATSGGVYGPGSIGATVYDGLESGGYAGGQNWLGDWQEGGESDGSAQGGVVLSTAAPFLGLTHLAIVAAERSVSRTADLSAFTLPVLRFARQVDASTTNAYYLDLFDGYTWTTASAWGNGDRQGVYVQETLDLRPYASGTTAIRFRSGSSLGVQDHLYLDQVEIIDAAAINHNHGEAIGKLAYSNALFNPTDEATVYISPVSVIKSVSQSRAHIDDTLVYTLACANISSHASGGITATNVTVRDVVPVQHATLESASDGYTFNGATGIITWSLGTLTPSASQIVTFAVRVHSFVQDRAIIANVATIECDQSVAAESNIVRTTALASDVLLRKSGPTVSRQGKVITYTLSFENTGQAAATGVSIHDIVPLSTTYVPGSLAAFMDTRWIPLSEAMDQDQGALISSTLVITPGVTPGILAVGESGQIRFSVRISDDVRAGALILNWSTLRRDLDSPRDSNLVITRISDLSVFKSARQSVSAPSSTISYTLTYENASQTISQTQVTVREAIPDYTVLIPGSVYGANGEQIWYSFDNDRTYVATFPVTPVTHLRWVMPEVGPDTDGGGASASTVGFAVRVKEALPADTTISNLGYISSTEVAATIRQWIPSNQIDIGTVGLWVKASANRSLVQPGGTVIFSIAYGNDGHVDDVGIMTSNVIPHSVTSVISNSISGGGVTDGSTVTWTVALPAQAVGPPIGAVNSTSFAITVSDPLPSGVDVITNLVSINSGYGFIVTDVVTVLVRAAPDLAVSKVGAPTVAVKGGMITYTIAISNVANQNATGVIVRDVLPAQTLLASASDGGVRTDHGGSSEIVTWPPFDLKGGQRVTRTLVVTVPDSLPVAQHVLTNVVSVTDDGSNGPDRSTKNNVYTYTTLVNDAPELIVVKDDGVYSVAPGDEITFVLTVSNLGHRLAAGVVVTDWLPDYVTLTAVSGGGAETAPSSGIVVWPPFILGPGARVIYTVTVALDDPLPAGVHSLSNIARIADDGSNGPDLDPRNNVFTLTTPIHAASDLVVSKVGQPPSFPPTLLAGRVLTYTITLSNAGSQNATNVVLTDRFPEYALFAYASHDGTWSPGTGGADQRVTWTIDTLDVGAAVTRTLVVTLSAAVPSGQETITNVVHATDPAHPLDPTPQNNVYTYTTMIGYAPALSLLKTGPLTAPVGAVVSFSFTVAHDATTGDGTPIGNLMVYDDHAGLAALVGGDDGNGLLESGETWVYVASYRIHHTDPSPLWNRAVVTGQDAAGAVVSATAAHSMTIGYRPVLNIIKYGPDVARIGDTVVFTFAVSNVSIVPTAVSGGPQPVVTATMDSSTRSRGMAIGDGSPIRHVSVTDDRAGVATYRRGDDGDGLLEVGEVWLFKVSYKISYGDGGPGGTGHHLVNTATAVGADGNGRPVSAQDSHSTYVEWFKTYFPVFLERR